MLGDVSMILVSACLLGNKTRYDGGAAPNALLLRYNHLAQYIAVCPECFGQLPIPHPPSEIQNGDGAMVLAGKAKVISKTNTQDITANFCEGADKVLKIAQAYKVKYAFLKEDSPSCGVNMIYDGTFSKTKVCGQGVCAALLVQNGIKVYSEEDLTEDLLKKILEEDKKID